MVLFSTAELGVVLLEDAAHTNTERPALVIAEGFFVEFGCGWRDGMGAMRVAPRGDSLRLGGHPANPCLRSETWGTRLLDENLSGRLVETLADVYSGSEQVLTSGLGGAGDGAVWEYARLHGFTIVSKDSDFFDRSVLTGAPPKVIWIRLGNCSTQEVERMLRSKALEMQGFFEDGHETCLRLGR